MLIAIPAFVIFGAIVLFVRDAYKKSTPYSRTAREEGIV
jgi:hypothetical protein